MAGRRFYRRARKSIGPCAKKCSGRPVRIFRKCVRVCMRRGRMTVTVAPSRRRKYCRVPC